MSPGALIDAVATLSNCWRSTDDILFGPVSAHQTIASEHHDVGHDRSTAY